MSATPASKTVIVFSHCHWDIEWYLPFRSFRFWLIQILDTLQIRFGEHPAYRNYMLDGQVAPLDHYLEVRPECREAMQALVRRGALSVGPFYTQYDEWLTSPESIVRNCLRGNRRAREYGGVMKAGYLPDNFGHPLQMPQILAGFGLNSLIFMRGMSERPEGMGDQFVWQGLDGSRVMAIHLSHGYHNAVAAGSNFDFSSIHRTTPFQDNYRTPEPFWRTANHTDIDAGVKALIQAADRQAPLCPSNIIPLANGVDHTPPQAFIGEMIARANQTQEVYRFVQADVAELARLIAASGVELPVLGEELYGGRYQLILTGTLASRAYLKQDNFAAEALMEQYAEPLATLAMLSGAPYPERLLEEAWTFLFLSQAHDGIHGSSDDSVHVEMRQRFAAARQVATGLCHQSLALLGRAHAVPRPNATPILAFAPAVPKTGTTLVDTWVAAGGEFHVADAQGHPVPFQMVANPHQYPTPGPQRSATVSWPGGPADKHILFEAPLTEDGSPSSVATSVPVLGADVSSPPCCGSPEYRETRTTEEGSLSSVATSVPVLGADVSSPPCCGSPEYRESRTTEERLVRGTVGCQTHVLSTFHVVAGPAPSAPVSGLRTSETTMENDSVRVTVSGSGVSVLDKGTGRTYANVLEFEDEADSGDIWDFSPTWKPVQPVTSRGAPTRVTLVENGPVRASLRLETTLRLPRRLEGEDRSAECVETVLTTTLSISRSSPTVSVLTELDNQSKDHRLRMRIDAGLDAAKVKSQTLFGAIERPLRHPAEGKDKGWSQMAPRTFPFREWVAVDDGQAGLAVAGRGMYEYESVREGAGVSLYVTLLRCVGVMGRHGFPYRQGATSPGNPTPDAQCQGPCRFEYALIPFRPEAGSAPFIGEARAFLYPPIAHQVLAPEAAATPAAPLFAMEKGELLVSAVKKAQDGRGVVLRLWENDGRAVKQKIRLSPAVSKVFLCNLNEDIEREVPVWDGVVTLEAGPYKILTLLLLPA